MRNHYNMHRTIMVGAKPQLILFFGGRHDTTPHRRTGHLIDCPQTRLRIRKKTPECKMPQRQARRSFCAHNIGYWLVNSNISSLCWTRVWPGNGSWRAGWSWAVQRMRHHFRRPLSCLVLTHLLRILWNIFTWTRYFLLLLFKWFNLACTFLTIARYF